MIKYCSNCKFWELASRDEPCSSCVVAYEKWQPCKPEAVDASHLLETAVDIRIAELETRLTALEAEVKRLASRKVCEVCHGIGLVAHIENGLHGAVETCDICNGTGYIESKEK